MKVPLKKYSSEKWGYKKIFAARGFELEQGGWKYFKKRELDKKGVEKK